MPLLDVDSIYRIPGMLQNFGLDSFVVERFGLNCKDRADLSDWDDVLAAGIRSQPWSGQSGDGRKIRRFAGCLQIPE